MKVTDEVIVNKEVVLRGADKVILRSYSRYSEAYNYYLFSEEGDIIMQILDCGCTRIPKVMKDKFDDFSIEKQHAKDRQKFKEWLKLEGWEK